MLGFLLAWAVLLLASGISISVLGFRLAPPGSAPLDTVAVVLLAVPAAILARCANTRLPEYERTRSRERQPSQLIWAAMLGGCAMIVPLAINGLLHPAINGRVFAADWYLAIGSCLLLTALIGERSGALGAFALLVIFSTPGLVPWEANIVYNVELGGVALLLGTAVVVAGILATAFVQRVPLARRARRSRGRNAGGDEVSGSIGARTRQRGGISDIAG